MGNRGMGILYVPDGSKGETGLRRKAAQVVFPLAQETIDLIAALKYAIVSAK